MSAGYNGFSWEVFDGLVSIDPYDPPEFRNHSLSLDGRIGVNFYVNTYPYKNAKMTFTITHGDCTKEQVLVYQEDATEQNPATPYKNGCYVFTCYVNSIQMAETITATLSYDINDTTRESVSNTFSVMDYFTYFDAHENDRNENDQPIFSEKAKDLIKALKNYGYYMQLFLSPEKDWALRSETDEVTVGYLAVDTAYENIMRSAADAEGDANAAGITKLNWEDTFSRISYSLVLDSETSIKVFFTPAENVTAMPAVTLDGKTYEPEKVGARYVVRIDNIAAHQLADIHTITAGGATVKVSAVSYVRSMLDEVSSNAAENTDAWKNNNHKALPSVWTDAALAIYTYWYYAYTY